MNPPVTIEDATALVVKERSFNHPIPQQYLKQIVLLMHDEIMRQRGYIEQLQAQLDAAE